MSADLLALPGGDLVETGLRDLVKRVVSDESLLVSIGRPRLSERFGDTAHGRYDALVRRLISFERALGCAGS